MAFRFFIGSNEQEVEPHFNDSDPAAHYAYCVEQALEQLDRANNSTQRGALIQEFIINMRENETTKKMITDVEALITVQGIESNQTAREHITGFMVPDKGYLTYSRPTR